MAALLFGTECLLATVLWDATVLAWYGRGRRSWTRLAVACLAGILLTVPWVLAILLVGAFYKQRVWESPVFWGLGLMAAGALVARGWLWVRGMWHEVDGNPRAAGWPWGRLALAALVSTLLAQSTLWMLDAQARSGLVECRREAQLLAQSVAPTPLRVEENAAPRYHQVFDAMGFTYRPPANPPQATVLSPAPPTSDAPESQPPEPGIPDFQSRYWLAVCQQLDEHRPAQQLPPDWQSPRLANFLERNRGVRALILEATSRPGCNFEREYTRPSIDILNTEIQNARGIARLLAVDARHAATLPDWPRVREDLVGMFRLARHVDEDPFVHCSLVALAIEKLAVESWNSIVAKALDPPTPLFDEALVPHRDPLARVDRAMHMEEAVSMLLVPQIHQHLDQSWLYESGIFPRSDQAIGLFDGSLVRALLLSDTIDDFRRAYSKLHQVHWNAQIKSIELTLKTAESTPPHTPLAELLLPAFRSAFEAALRGEARARQMRIAIGLYRYYHSPRADGSPRHAFPATLDELLPDYVAYLPSDPFTDGQPLRYRRTRDGCLLYSLGPNLRDDGGREDRSRVPTIDDVLFACRAPHPMNPVADAPASNPSGLPVGDDPAASLAELAARVEAALRAFDQTHSTIYPKGFSRCRLDVQQVTHELLPPAEGQDAPAAPRGVVRAQYRETHTVIRPTPEAAATDEELFPRSPREDRPTMLNDRLNPEKPVWDLQIEYRVEDGQWVRQVWSGKARTARGADYLDRLGLP